MVSNDTPSRRKISPLQQRTDDFSLRNQQSQLILSFVGQLAELHTADFGADSRSEFDDLSLAFREQIWESWVGILSVVVVLEGGPRGHPVLPMFRAFVIFSILGRLHTLPPFHCPRQADS
jgi:hypothetical protein